MLRRAALVAMIVLGLAGAAAMPAEARTVAVCEDTDDNDGDGLVDLADPGCDGPYDYSEKVTTPKQDAEYDAEGFLAVEFGPTSGDRVSCRRGGSRWTCIGRFRQWSRWPYTVRLTMTHNFARYRTIRFRTRCGDLQRIGAGVYDVTTLDVRCKSARRLAHRFFYRTLCFKSCRVSGFRCVTRKTGIESGRAKCARDGRVIRFVYGA